MQNFFVRIMYKVIPLACVLQLTGL